MKRILIVAAGLALVGAWTTVAAGDSPTAADSDPRFEFLKSLAGSWVSPAPAPDMPDGSWEFRVTAGGSAVEEREMAGTPMEMVTLYHMDGKKLVATHYCMLGNQPRLEAARRVDDGPLSFACSGVPGNARSHDEHHVHGWTMWLDEEGRLHNEAELVESGRVTRSPSVVLTRVMQRARN